MGARASEAAREWFADNRYQDYLYLHGLSVEMAEAFAEYVHKRIRGELGFAAEEARDHDEMLNQGYRGSRYSFGYPACPNLADQRQLLDLLGADRDRPHAQRRRPARPRAIDLGHRRPPPAGQVFFGVRTHFRFRGREVAARRLLGFFDEWYKCSTNWRETAD